MNEDTFPVLIPHDDPRRIALIRGCEAMGFDYRVVYPEADYTFAASCGIAL